MRSSIALATTAAMAIAAMAIAASGGSAINIFPVVGHEDPLSRFGRKSRGKGQGKNSPSRHKVAMDRRGVKKVKEPKQSRSKYMPTYGENRQRRADARRQQRIEALAA